MLDFTTMNIADFGKIIFVPKNHTIPALPDMNLLVIKNETTFQAICIDIELDAVGNTVKDACDNLKQTLHMYITQMVNNYDGNVETAARDIINVSFSQGIIKSQLFAKYLEIKHQYILDKIIQKRKVKSRKEAIIDAWNRISQIEPIRLNLTLAAGIA